MWTTAFNGAEVEAGCARAAEDTAALLASLGHHVEATAPTALSDPGLWAAAKQALVAQSASEADHWTARLGRPLAEDDVEPTSWASIAAGRAMSASEILHVLERLQGFATDAQRWWHDHDVLVTPTTAAAPTPLGEYLGAGYQSGRGSAFTRPFNVTGNPAVSLPLGWPDDGLPRGVQLIAAYGREDVLIRMSSQLEVAAPWAHRRPPGLTPRAR